MKKFGLDILLWFYDLGLSMRTHYRAQWLNLLSISGVERHTDVHYWTTKVVDFVVSIPACEALANTENVPVTSSSILKEGSSVPSLSV